MKYYLYNNRSTRPVSYEVYRYDIKGAIQTIVRGLPRHKDAVSVLNALEDETDMVEQGRSKELIAANH